LVITRGWRSAVARSNDSLSRESKDVVEMSRRTVLRLGADDWARSRFVRSLLFETIQASRALTHSRKQVHQRTWLDTIDQPGARDRLAVLAAVNPTSGWVPGFIAPPPRPGDRSIEDELAEVAATPAARIVDDLRHSLASRPTLRRRAVLEPLIADPDAALAVLLAELKLAWTLLIEPFWPPVRELIGTDIAHRSRQIARVGLGRALADVDARVSWTDASITVDPAFEDAAIDLAGQGLALMPSAFLWPDVVVLHESPWPTTLAYPARGIGALWSAPPSAPTGLAGVLGATRARLLSDLAQPATTTALAARHRLSPAAVSTQLGRLRDAGLVTGQRLGKEVHYRRTSLADDLIHAKPPSA
jgi:DNA-binding transcriptional ArsR family regulator